MENLGRYIISVTAASLLCSTVSCLFSEGTSKTLIRMLCGLILTITALAPMLRTDLTEQISWEILYSDQGNRLANSGKNAAQQAADAFIKQQTEAYILDKAAQLNAAVTVEITLSQDQIPAQAAIHGKISPYAKGRLENILASDLGITKEHQLWTG